jgi:hypothetical protein
MIKILYFGLFFRPFVKFVWKKSGVTGLCGLALPTMTGGLNSRHRQD